MRKIIFKAGLWLIVLTTLGACSSRGWQLSQQLEGYNNKLDVTKQQVEVKEVYKDSKVMDRNLASLAFSTLDIVSNETVPTSMGQDGLLLISK